MKLATWNVERPVAARRRVAIRAEIDKVGADLLVLTEAHDGLPTSYAHAVSSAPGRDSNQKARHRWVTICSHSRLERIHTTDKQRTAAARVFPNTSDPFIVFGTVLPWLGSTWEDFPSAGGVAFQKALDVQAADWRRIKTDHLRDEFFILGDLNQDLVSPRYYGSRANRTALETALSDAGMVVLTGGTNDPVRRDSPPHASIDHICARSDSAWRAEAPMRWPSESDPVKGLSDHFGISVELVR